MLSIENITIREFRGIRNLDLDLKGKNFGICGPNGTGKSGVVDAIEFCLTGDVTRLSGQGTGILSVKQYAPHVDERQNPEKAIVKVTATISSLNKQVTIERSVKKPRDPKISSADPDVNKIIAEVETHPEFALSRREIVKYIVTPPGDRSKEVQALLRLEELENVRTAINYVSNECEKETRNNKGELAIARNSLLDGLGLKELSKEEILGVINEKRIILSLDSIQKLKLNTSLIDGVVSASDGNKESKLNKKTALADVNALNKAIGLGENKDARESREALIVKLEGLKDDVKAFKLIRNKRFVENGIALLDGNACPLCDTEWNEDELRTYLEEKLQNVEQISSLIAKLEDGSSPIIEAMQLRAGQMQRVTDICQQLDPVIRK